MGNMKRILALSILGALLLLSGAAAAKEKTVELEVAIFQGGFGMDHFEYVAREYEKLHPNVKISLTGNPRIGIVLRPRFLQGNPPDVTWLIRDGVSNAELLRAGLIHPLTEAMESPAYFQEDKAWKDTIMPSTLYTLTDGSDEIWGVSLDLLTWNMWYNADMFEEHGWEPPTTFDELLELSAAIKEKGIYPIALQGMIPDYNIYWMMQFIQRQGGLDALNAALNHEKGAWNNEVIIESARKLRTLFDNDVFQDGAMGMDHTQAQTMFVLGDAAMIACGSWLPAEMGNITPEGFRMVPFQYPVFADGIGDPNVLNVMASEKWIVPAHAKNKEVAVDFLKFLTSLPMAQRFVAEKDSMTTIIDSNVGLPPELELIAEMVEKAERSFSHVEIEGWYPTWFLTFGDLTTSLMIGEITPEQFARGMEDASRRVREDDSIIKYKVNY